MKNVEEQQVIPAMSYPGWVTYRIKTQVEMNCSIEHTYIIPF